jgi:hypothetical protein
MNALDLDRRYERTKQFLGMSLQLLRFFPCVHVWRLLPSVDRVQEPRRDLLFGRARPCIRETPLLVQVVTLGADCHLTILPKAAAPMWRGTGAASQPVFFLSPMITLIASQTGAATRSGRPGGPLPTERAND